MTSAYQRIAHFVSRPCPSFHPQEKIIDSPQRFSGRRSPSNEKIQFLLHFGDCCQVSLTGFKHASTLLERLRGPGIEGTSRTETHIEWSQKAQNDIDFCIKELTDVEKETHMLKKMVWFTPKLQ